MERIAATYRLLFVVTSVESRVVAAVFDDAQPIRNTESLVLAAVAAATATALAGLEIRQLHARGYHLRTGPWH